jgi:hypothetical protein
MLLKKLDKPEMLLLNHLQNQIKMYYPEQSINKNRQLQEELGLSQYEEKNRLKNKTVELS